MNGERPGNKSTPRLRFPEFRETGEWDAYDLGELTDKVGSGITPLGGDKNYKRSGRPFIRSQNVGWGELILDDVAFIDEETHKSFDATELQELDVLLNITGASIGRSAMTDSRVVGGNVNQHVCIIRVKPESLNARLLNQYLISHDGQKQIDSFQAGGNRQGLNFAQIRSFHIPLPPSPAEQRKIAACLGSLDDWIGAEGRKLEALRSHKKGLMQRLFPRPGESRPRLRFAEFHNAGEWASHTLGNVVTISKGKGVAKADVVENGLTPCIRYAELYTTYGEVIINVRSRTDVPVDDLVLSEPEDVIIPASGETKEDIATCACVVNAGVALGSDLNVLRSGINGQFLSYYLNGSKRAELAKVAQGDTVAHLYPSQISRLGIHVPPSPAEQRRIAACLSSLDDLLSAQSRKVEGLKSHKKGLMQRLFPSGEG